MTANASILHRSVYGAQETNGLVNDATYHSQWHGARLVDWTTPGLQITWLRLLSDPGFPWWYVSYCHGWTGDEPVRVQVPFDRLMKGQKGCTLAHQIVAHARRDGVYAKGIGIFEAISKPC